VSKRPAPPIALERKAVNDAAAYLRGLAQLRGRNAEWAERSVREGLSLSAEDALKQDVIDFIAPDIAALAARLDGARVRVLGRELTLQTAAAPRVMLQPDFVRACSPSSPTSVALILMSIGIYGLIFEFMSPGAIAPGVISAICRCSQCMACNYCPSTTPGLALIILGILFMIAEAFLPSFGVLGLGGVAAFVAGALILIDTELPGYGIPAGLVATVALSSAALVIATVGVALRTRRRAAVGDHLVGGPAEMLDATSGGEGWANAGGETWRVVSPVPLGRGQAVRIVGRKGAALEVVPIDNPNTGEVP
jgi:membrane-bound serine protease (ClpP class)